MTKLLFVSTLLLLMFSINYTTFCQSFYPLQIGNRWDYKVNIIDWLSGYGTSYFQTVKVVKDSIFPNGNRYFILNGDDFIWSRVVRTDSQFIYYLDQYNLTDVPFYKLSGQIGDTTYMNYYRYHYTTLESRDTISLFNHPTSINQYRLDGLTVQEVKLSDKFGPISSVDFGCVGSTYTYHTLLGCIIGDSIYGNILGVQDLEPNPNQFSLLQNFPNPFNPLTTIQFTLPHSGFVTLTIYSLLGEEIATILSQNLAAGKYSAKWNAIDIPSGVYFYCLKAGSFTETKKIVLIK